MKNIYQFSRNEEGIKALWHRKIERYLCRLNIKFSKERKHRMAVFANDFISVKIFTEGIFERIYLESLTEFLSFITKKKMKHMSALDIGANIGNHSIFFAGYFKKVYSFEPHPLTYKLLAFNSEPYTNIKIFNFGLGDKNKKINLYSKTGNIGASTSSDKDNHSKQKNIVQIKTLDKCKLKLKNIGLIKIDVEGMEFNVLNGGINLIKNQTPIIVFEQLEHEFKKSTGETKTINFLKGIGYKFYWLEKQKKRKYWQFFQIFNPLKIINGEKIFYNIVTDTIIPPRFYEMLIAIPPRYRNDDDNFL
jgi:FkbM family methyltransferase